LSKITLGGVELPKQTSMPKLKYEPVVLYSNPSVTGRLHNVYQRCFDEQLNVSTVLFERIFTFEIVNIDEPTYSQLNAIDGTNCVLKFERDTYTEEFDVNLDMTFFKFDDHIWFDCVNISATVAVVEEVPPQEEDTLFFLGDLITPPGTVTDNLFFLGELI